MTYLVITPAYERGGSYWEPGEYGSDVVEVEAKNRQEARIIGVRELRKLPKGYLQRYNDENPFKGLKVEPV